MKIGLPVKKISKVDKLSKQYVFAFRNLEKFKKKHARIFEDLEVLTSDLQNVEVQLKDAARLKAKTGETVTVVDLPDIVVEVRGDQSSVQYSPEKIRKYFGIHTFEKVAKTIIDREIISELVLEGKIDSEKLEKAQLPREPQTPKCFIRVI